METVDWGYVLSTLAIRYIAIFMVLTLLIILLTVNGAIVSKLTAIKAKKKERPATPKKPEKEAPVSPRNPTTDQITPETLAAIGLAINLYQNQQMNQKTILDESNRNVSEDQWRLAGRQAQWNKRR